MKRIAFIRRTYDPFGGAENYIDTLINNLNGYEIHMLSSQWKETPRAVRHTVDSASLSSARSVTKFNRNAARIIRQIEPDCTVSFERTTSQDIYRAGDGCHRQWLNIRRLISGRLKGLSFHFNMLHRTLLSIEKELFNATPVIIANSNMVKRNIIEHYKVPEAKIHVLYNGVDLTRFNAGVRGRLSAEFRREFNVKDDTAIVLFVGSGFERKGLGVLIEAMTRINTPAVLYVAGRGRTGKYEALSRRLGVHDKVIFAGAATGIERFYAAADVFVLPTLYDPFSNATLEAMASGCAVITTKNNGAAEIIEDARDGMLLNNMADPEELAGKIDKAIPICRELGCMATKKAAAYSIGQAAGQFSRLIEDYCLNK
ncbi:glycosyltransferase family 4 protein [Candidatus Magnetominusculus xianensis]|uniref:Glycosyl transferase family 1 n=1 Tax=Candidatus Magnetominusculus xianensis TaxID=1748249 RepID=A0ABR5SJ63_9BACT|nr:glycosyltransferase family 4 protein [Candidatus Magnetominusculus xianensis]KWT94221.1 glycosyl transferase family 1 [Candidatus Magnetominusculus xianensis]MBF0402998.1 glycosyltransferase family 4 protein [Nitrospirota bacterium]